MHEGGVQQVVHAQISWAELATGRVVLVDQVERDGEQLVIVAPCVPPSTLRSLTAIEDRIARLAGQAFGNKEIAFTLKLNESAVENHLSRALRKLGLRDRVALVRLYTQLEAAGYA